MTESHPGRDPIWKRLTSRWVSTRLIRECRTKHSCPLLGILAVAVVCAVALPLINSLVIFPAYTKILVNTFEDSARRLAAHTIPSSLKNTRMTHELLDAPHFLGDIYRLERNFGLLAVKVFSPEGFTLYSTFPNEVDSLNMDPGFVHHVARGSIRTVLGKTVIGTSTRDTVEVDVPFMRGGVFLGAFGIVFDVTEPKSQLDRFNDYATYGTILVCACLVFVVISLLPMEMSRTEAQKQAEALREDVEHITRHDIKGPLLGALNGISYLENYTKLNQEQMDMLADMREAVNTGMTMINRSLDVYKMEKKTYQYDPVDLDILEICRRVVTDLSGFALEQGVSVKTSLSGRRLERGDTLTIRGEEVLLYAILANLLKNAVEASENGDLVDIAVESGEALTIAFHNRTAVPEAVRDNFFGKYATAGKRTGTGLGTYSARLMTEVMGGSIAMESFAESGTTVTVTLPLSTAS